MFVCVFDLFVFWFKSDTVIYQGGVISKHT